MPLTPPPSSTTSACMPAPLLVAEGPSQLGPTHLRAARQVLPLRLLVELRARPRARAPGALALRHRRPLLAEGGPGLRRDVSAAEEFPRDVLELQGYLSGSSRVPGVEAVPGAGTEVPLYILGSSLFGAKLAAVLGLPYAFASHFAPEALQQAVALYRQDFEPSTQLQRPYVIAGVNVVAADTEEEAGEQHRSVVRSR